MRSRIPGPSTLAVLVGATPVWRLLLFALLLPFGLSGLHLAGQAAGLYGTLTGVVLLAAANALLLGAVVLWTTKILRRTELERRGSEAQVLEAQRMEAAGQLASGIAHEFNNLLTLILVETESLAAELGPAHPGAPRLQGIGKAGARAAELTRQLLAFSRRQVVQPTLLDLNDFLRSTERLLRPLIGESIALMTVPAPEPALVEADGGQIEQVLVNLAVNSRDAMPHGGRLVLTTASLELDAAGAAAAPGGRPGAYVVLSVTDTGCGMDAATRARLFEPFFTTKEPGQGTGLGLASVHGIVSQSGGHIAVDSEPGRGTTFKIYLPRAVRPRPAAPPRQADAAAEGIETVLVVEDLAPLRALVSRILHDAGYTVLEASDPEKARMQSLAHDGPIHCLLTDVVMPHMSGGELALKLQAERAGLKVVFMSGYPAEVIGQHGVLDPGTHFLHKPFSRRDLLRKLRQALDEPPAAG